MALGRRMKGGEIGFEMIYSVDLMPVLRQIESVVKQSMLAASEDAVVDAQKLAPVRRVVKGDRGGKTRRLTVAERKSETDIRRRLGISVGRASVRTAAESRRNRHVPSNPYLRAPGRRPPRTDPPELRLTRGGGFAAPAGTELNRHGRKELARGVAIKGPTVFGRGDDDEVRRNRAKLRRTNSAVFFKPTPASTIAQGLRGGGRYTLGGRLRGEIHSEPADVAEGIEKWWVISPTYYARYVEFGTRRSKAQPFLRPALAMQRRKLLDRMRTNLRKLNWKPKRKHVRTRA